MRTQPKRALVAALSLASGLWLTPVAFAHDDHHSEHRRSWYSAHLHSDRANERYNRRYYDSSRPYQQYQWGLNREHSEQHQHLQHQYGKAMNRLARQEREAREKAYRRYEGNSSDWRYRERLAEIDRKYDHKRDKVERNIAKEHARGHRELSREYRDYRNDWWD